MTFKHINTQNTWIFQIWEISAFRYRLLWWKRRKFHPQKEDPGMNIHTLPPTIMEVEKKGIWKMSLVFNKKKLSLLRIPAKGVGLQWLCRETSTSQSIPQSTSCTPPQKLTCPMKRNHFKRKVFQTWFWGAILVSMRVSQPELMGIQNQQHKTPAASTFSPHLSLSPANRGRVSQPTNVTQKNPSTTPPKRKLLYTGLHFWVPEVSFQGWRGPTQGHLIQNSKWTKSTNISTKNLQNKLSFHFTWLEDDGLTMFNDPRMFFPEKLAEQKGTHLPKTNSSPVKIGLPTPQKERLVFFQTPVFRGGVLVLRSVTYSKFLPWRSHPIWSTVMFHGFTVTLWGGSFKYSLLFKTVQHVLIMCLRLPSETMNRGGWLK